MNGPKFFYRIGGKVLSWESEDGRSHGRFEVGREGLKSCGGTWESELIKEVGQDCPAAVSTQLSGPDVDPVRRGDGLFSTFIQWHKRGDKE